jgi:hypothetical protein
MDHNTAIQMELKAALLLLASQKCAIDSKLAPIGLPSNWQFHSKLV